MAKKQLKSKEQEYNITLAQNKFLDDTAHNIAQTCNNIKDEDFDFENAKKKGLSQLEALEVQGSLQAMIASQMLSIHKYQQLAMVMAHGLPAGEYQQYYTNTAIKLANTFVQQANLLSKLQGRIGQKITVERVNECFPWWASSYWYCECSRLGGDKTDKTAVMCNLCT